MGEYNRKNTLNRLIKSVFKRKMVGFDDDNYERGIYGEIEIGKIETFNNHSYTNTYRKKYDILFDITFNTVKYKFYYSNSNSKKKFSRDNAIQNIVNYFKEFGINFPNCFENAHEKYLFSKLIYKLISTELLPAIFITEENVKCCDKKVLGQEDITADFTIAIKNIKAVLESNDIVSIIYRNAKMSDIETVYENNYKEPRREYNLVTCMCIEEVEEYLYELWSFDPIIEMYIATKPYEIYNSELSDFSGSIEKLKKQSLLLSMDGMAAFEFPNDIYSKQRTVDGIIIKCLNNIATFSFLPRYFYYAPKLDQYSSEFRENGFLRSEVTVYQNMRRNAAKALQEKYQAKFKKYYENIMKTIITNTDMLSSVDYEYLLIGNRCEKQELAKALGNMWQDINRLYAVLYDGDYDAADIKAVIIWLIEYSVSMMNNAIEEIIAVPHRIIGVDKDPSTNVSGFITQLRNYVSKSAIRKFATKIEASFDKLQQVEELFEANHSDVYGKIEEVGAYISIDVKSEFGSTNKKLTKINLDEAVFKNFHQNLIQLTSALKKNNNAPA